MIEYALTTLSPVHVGSGRELLANSEFVYFEKERVFAIISQKKVLDVIGEAYLDQWVAAINNNESLLSIIKQRKRDIVPNDVAAYILNATRTAVNKTQNVREHMRTNGLPYIPGSSIKGSIRTAVINHLMLQTNKTFDDKIAPFRGRFSDRDLLKSLLGPDANSNSFRFLKIGDAHFENDQLEVGQADLLNLYGNRPKAEVKRGAGQLIEQIMTQETSTLQLKIDDYKLIEQNKLRVDTSFLQNRKALEKIVNEHTKRMIENELIDLEDDFDIKYSPYSNIIKFLNEILAQVNSCIANGGMVLRLGFGIGWTFTTGAWAKNEKMLYSLDIYGDIKRASRPNRRNTDYGNMPFPKTRKLAAEQQLLGFIKLEAC